MAKLPSGITLRSPPSRPRAAPNGSPSSATDGASTSRSTKYKVTIELREPVFKLLTAAAARRATVSSWHNHKPLPVETLAAQILGGVLTRGSIDRALAAWGEYGADSRAVDQ